MFSLEKYKMEGKKFYMQYMFDFLYSYIIRGVFLGNPLVDDSRRGRRWMALAALALKTLALLYNSRPFHNFSSNFFVRLHSYR